MTDIICPFCGGNLERGSISPLFGCPKCRIVGSLELWTALIDTKKQLEMAVGELDYIQEQVEKSRAFGDKRVKHEREK